MVILNIVFIDLLDFNDHLGNKSASIRQTAVNKNFLRLLDALDAKAEERETLGLTSIR